MKLNLERFFDPIENDKKIEVQDIKIEKYKIEIFFSNVSRPCNTSMSSIENIFNVKGITG